MRQVFRAADTTRHCGVNTKVACIVLGTLVTVLEIFCFLFLPLIAGIILISIAALVYIVLILTIVKMMRGLLIIFMIFNGNKPRS
ncbi:hypothetical protein RB195_013344 [Necator americanus]|uniref:Uncharacterized protein n=1 Tax=Necator americanus TaxID=51031 RepID=A0ABR1DWK8_NECAM